MSLLTLKDIGKIYVSEGNVAVGIRGVNLSFDKGEFVAITGKSGSGKSTLLNVISGMDTYEEGELFIEGEPTSHYLQPDWEEFREKYISFIFQDYNIIESFTVLQNVELALMHIADKKERRERAVELIKRVGLASHMKHKGSRLSGGQKQRTVIARALAKDSPIILADEPTGNLDSQTSKEIIELLKEVSCDKLLIVVTHNFEEVESYATRHVRTFDGSIESDHIIRAREEVFPVATENKEVKEERPLVKTVKNGIKLGATIFTAKPKLSVFLCFLMLVGTLGIFLVTSFCGDAPEAFKPKHMFSYIDGRVVITKRSGEVITSEELDKLLKENGAESYLRFDTLLDEGINNQMIIYTDDPKEDTLYPVVNYVFSKDYGTDIVGRYPEAANEVFLYLPVSLQPYLGKDELKINDALLFYTTYKIVGVKYYYDNNKTAECLFTEEGFRVATAIHYLINMSSHNMWVSISDKNGEFSQKYEVYDVYPSFDIASDKIYVSGVKELEYPDKYESTVTFKAIYHNYNYNYNGSGQQYSFEKTFDQGDITNKKPADVRENDNNIYASDCAIYISDDILYKIAEEVLNKSYRQASLFFANDKEAKKAIDKLSDQGYIAVLSNTSYEPDPLVVILELLGCIMIALVWVLAVIFLAFFVNLCSSRTIGAFKGDMAIMRSMGISVKVIRVGMYVRMLISLIPAFILVAAVAVLIFTSPKFNGYFVYLYGWQYALIFVGMIILTVRVTHKQIKKLFNESVKKSLKGGASV